MIMSPFYKVWRHHKRYINKLQLPNTPKGDRNKRDDDERIEDNGA